MQNVVNKMILMFVLMIGASQAMAQDSGNAGYDGPPGEGPGVGGTYICNYCDPTNPLDGNTQEFIRSTVNHDVDEWEPGDSVIITDGNGNSGEWGRVSATSSFTYFGSGGGGLTQPCGIFQVCDDRIILDT